MGELIRQVCNAFEIEVLKHIISKNHIHLLVSAPTDTAPGKITRKINGQYSTKLFENIPGLMTRY